MSGWFFKGHTYSGALGFLDIPGLGEDSVGDWYIPDYGVPEETSGGTPGAPTGDSGELVSVDGPDGHHTYYLPAPSPVIKAGGFMMFEKHGGDGPGAGRFINYDSSFQFRGNIKQYDILDLRDKLGNRVDFVEYSLNNLVLGQDYWDNLVSEPSVTCPNATEPLCGWNTQFSGIGGTESGYTIELKQPPDGTSGQDWNNNDPENWGATTILDSGLCYRNSAIKLARTASTLFPLLQGISSISLLILLGLSFEKIDRIKLKVLKNT